MKVRKYAFKALSYTRTRPAKQILLTASYAKLSAQASSGQVTLKNSKVNAKK